MATITDLTPAIASVPGNAPVDPPTDNTKAIEKARKEEKDKLYPQLKALEAEVAKLTDRAAELELEVEDRDQQLTAKDTQIAAKEEQVKALQKAGAADGHSYDIAALTREITDTVKAGLSKEQGKNNKELQARLESLEQQNNSLLIDKVKAEEIAKLGGPKMVIEGMISGRTPDEVRASVKASYEVKLEILKEAGIDPESLKNSNASQGSLVPELPTAGQRNGNRRGDPESGLLKSVKGMSAEEYKQNRTKVKQELAERYPRIR